jgi:hypothetical protein
MADEVSHKHERAFENTDEERFSTSVVAGNFIGEFLDGVFNLLMRIEDTGFSRFIHGGSIP